MRFLPFLLLAFAGGILMRIALRAPEPSYTPLQVDTGPASIHVPRAVTADVPAGHVVRRFQVEGMCCDGCTQKLFDALTGLPGVIAAGVDFSAERVEALVPEDLSVETLTAALTFDKYAAQPLD